MREEELNWKLASMQHQLDEEREAMESMEELDLFRKSLSDYERLKSKRCVDVLRSNIIELRNALSTLTAERIVISDKDLKELYITVDAINQFISNNQDDIIISLLKDTLPKIDEYLTAIGKELPTKEDKYPEYPYGKPYYRYYKEKEYGKFYQLDEEDLLNTPYTELHPKLHTRKAQMHAERASKLLKQLEGVIERPSGIPTTSEGLELEAIERLQRIKQERMSKREQELSKVPDVTTELARKQKTQYLTREEELMQDPWYAKMKHLKEVSRRERARLGIQVEE